MNGFVLPSLNIFLLIILLVQTSRRAVKYHKLQIKPLFYIYNPMPIVCLIMIVAHVIWLAQISLNKPIMEGFYLFEVGFSFMLVFISRHIDLYSALTSSSP